MRGPFTERILAAIGPAYGVPYTMAVFLGIPMASSVMDCGVHIHNVTGGPLGDSYPGRPRHFDFEATMLASVALFLLCGVPVFLSVW